MFAAKKETLRPDAAVRGDTLVLSLPDAMTPVVWQFDLSSVKASALEVNPCDGGFMLRLKTPRGEMHDIASYAIRDQAVDVLSLVHRALVTGGLSKQRGAIRDEDRVPRRSQWRMAVSGVLIFIAVMWVMTSMFPPPSAGGVNAGSGSVPVLESGQPMSADEILGGGAN